MSRAEHLKALHRLAAQLPAPADVKTRELLSRVRDDPAWMMSQAGMVADPWQVNLLRTKWQRALLLCSRQAGKTQTAAALALSEALRQRSLIILLSQNLRSSGEMFRDKLLPLWRALDCPLRFQDATQLGLELSNGSRIVSLPSSEKGIRGYSGVRLLVVDEAARVSDELYRAVRPMLAVSGGRIICMTTPYGKRGFFHEEWTSARPWERVRIVATQCPRIDAAFLAEEREALGERYFCQEYLCEFMDTEGAVFREQDIHEAFANELEPLFSTCGVSP